MCVSVFSFVTSSFCLVLSVQISNLPSPACYEQSHRWTFVFVFCHRNCDFSLVSVFCLFKFQLFRLELVANGLTGELLYLCFCHRNCGFVYVFVLCLVIEVVVLLLCFVYSNSKYHRLQLVANSLTGELLPRHLLVLASIQPAQDPVSPVLKVLVNKQNSCLLKASKYSKYCRRVAKKIRNSLNSR